MLMARVVGFLVAVVAAVMWFLIMMIVRALLVWCIHYWGVSGVIVIVAAIVLSAMKYANMSFKLIWVMFRHSCS